VLARLTDYFLLPGQNDIRPFYDFQGIKLLILRFRRKTNHTFTTLYCAWVFDYHIAKGLAD